MEVVKCRLCGFPPVVSSLKISFRHGEFIPESVVYCPICHIRVSEDSNASQDYFEVAVQRWNELMSY